MVAELRLITTFFMIPINFYLVIALKSLVDRSGTGKDFVWEC